MTENNLMVDVIEFITDDNEEKIRELNLTEDDMPDGYYIIQSRYGNYCMETGCTDSIYFY